MQTFRPESMKSNEANTSVIPRGRYSRSAESTQLVSSCGHPRRCALRRRHWMRLFIFFWYSGSTRLAIAINGSSSRKFGDRYISSRVEDMPGKPISFSSARSVLKSAFPVSITCHRLSPYAEPNSGCGRGAC